MIPILHIIVEETAQGHNSGQRPNREHNSDLQTLSPASQLNDQYETFKLFNVPQKICRS